jgi:hypothetical protein
MEPRDEGGGVEEYNPTRANVKKLTKAAFIRARMAYLHRLFAICSSDSVRDQEKSCACGAALEVYTKVPEFGANTELTIVL